jgi:CheY-like chemotaxis protein
MEQGKSRILWIDDEIELLRPHIILLEQRGYNVDTATNGEDGIEMVSQNHYDLIFLDESMVGMSGLDTLPLLKDIDPSTPIVMATKNEAESVMEEAIGAKIDDYLTKPLNPAQILAACKKHIDSHRIKSEKLTQDYLQGFAEISNKLMDRLEWDDWKEIYSKLVNWSMQLDSVPDLGFEQTLRDQWRDCNVEYSKFVENNYQSWLGKDKPEGSPILSHEITEKYLFPMLENGKPTIFFVIDGMRLDQWLGMEELLAPIYSIKKDLYSAILPTATPYARNSIFAGLYPSDIAKYYPQWWVGEMGEDEHKQNAHEKEFMEENLKRKKITLKNTPAYVKIHETEYGKKIENNILSYATNHLTSIVINAVDMMAHSRSDYPILKEIAPNESAYRSLTNSWFQHSSFYNMLKVLSEMDVNILITTDHGTIRCLRAVKVLGDRDTSTCLRYKFGKNVKAEAKHAMVMKNPLEYKLPVIGSSISSIVAKEDYYFVYPTDYHHYVQRYRDSFQHGGISMEEMIIPIITLEPKLG